MGAAVARLRSMGESRGSRWGLMGGVLAFGIVLPLIVTDTGWQHDLIFALAYAGMALGLNVVVGFAGLLDLGYLAFYAIGSYSVAYFASDFFDKVGHCTGKGAAQVCTGVHVLVPTKGFETNLGHVPLAGFHVNFLIVLLIAAVLSAIAGVVIGLPTLRLRGDYIAIVTLAFGEIIRVFAVNGDSIHIGDFHLTNGSAGIGPLDNVYLPGLGTFYPHGELGQGVNNKPFYWIILAIIVIVLFINFRLRDSRLGRAWVALREDEVAAKSMGIPLVKTKLLSYATGAAVGGVCGAFLAYYNSNVRSNTFEFSFSIFVLSMIILGGLGSVWGVLAGAITLSLIQTRLIPDVLDDFVHNTLGIDFQVSDLSFGIFGFLLVIMMVLRPQGLFPERRRKMELTEGVGGDESLVEVQAP